MRKGIWQLTCDDHGLSSPAMGVKALFLLYLFVKPTVATRRGTAQINKLTLRNRNLLQIRNLVVLLFFRSHFDFQVVLEQFRGILMKLGHVLVGAQELSQRYDLGNRVFGSDCLLTFWQISLRVQCENRSDFQLLQRGRLRQIVRRVITLYGHFVNNLIVTFDHMRLLLPALSPVSKDDFAL